MPQPNFIVRRLGENFFAEIVGLDLAQPLDEATFRRVHAAHLEHGVVVFRDQKLTPEQHIAFSQRFGPSQIHSMSQFNLEDHPEILMVSNLKKPDGTPLGIADAGRYWHTDMSYIGEPALGSLLYARAIPSSGGDTAFADMQSAYEGLAPDMQAKLLKLRAIHHFGSRWARMAKAGLRPPMSKEEFERNPPLSHPLVRTHPETGRRCLYSGGFTIGIEGMAEDDALALLDALERHATQPRFVHRHSWRLHDLVFWDNRRVMHHAFDYPEGETRHMHRTTVKGTAPYLMA
jgi:taurine dioxygenase